MDTPEIPTTYRMEARPDCVLPLGRMTLEECLGVHSQLIDLVERAAGDLLVMNRTIGALMESRAE